MKHRTDDELVDRMYGLPDGGDRPANCPGDCPADCPADCPECAARLRAFEARRAQVTQEDELPAADLAAQRTRIYERIEHSPGKSMKWFPALAAAGLVAAGVFLYSPRPLDLQPAVPRPEPGDAQLFSDLYSMEQAAGPRAALPIRALFEEPK